MIVEITTEGLKYEGYATPIATLRTAMWAGLRSSKESYFECFTVEVSAGFRAADAEAAKGGCTTGGGCHCEQSGDDIAALRVLEEHTISNEEIELEYELLQVAGRGYRCQQPFRKVGRDWKISGPPRLL